MNTENVRDLLYDYVRGKLSKENAQAVEEQLTLSGELREELQRVRSYFDTVDVLEKHVPPEDFLQKVYSRIEANNPKNILHKLFLPLHVKVPFELAGVFATVMLIVFLFIPHLEREKMYEENTVGLVENAPEAVKLPVFEKVDSDIIGNKDSKIDNSISSVKKKIVNEGVNSPKQKIRSEESVLRKSLSDKKSPRQEKYQSKVGMDEEVTGGSQKNLNEMPAKSSSSNRFSDFESGTIPNGSNSIDGEFAESEKNEQNVSAAKPQVSPPRSLPEEIKTSELVSRKSDFILTVDMFSKIQPKSERLQTTPRKKSLRAFSKFNEVSDEEENRKKDSKELVSEDYSTDSNSSILLPIIAKYCLSWSVTDSASDTMEYLLKIHVNRVEAFLQEIKSIGLITRSGVIPQAAAYGSESLNTVNIHLRISNGGSAGFK